MRGLRQRNELDTERHEGQRGCRSRSSPVTLTVVGTAVSFILLVSPSIVVESVGLVVGVQTVSDSQLDVYRTVVVVTAVVVVIAVVVVVVVYRTVVVLLNLAQTIKFAGNFVFYVRLRNDQCPSARASRGTADGSGMEMYRFRHWMLTVGVMLLVGTTPVHAMTDACWWRSHSRMLVRVILRLGCSLVSRGGC